MKEKIFLLKLINMSMKKILFIFFFLLFIFFIGFFVFYQKIFLSHEKFFSPIENFSQENSYFYISPLKAKADGEERIRITIFILDKRGLGMKGVKVSLGYNSDLLFDSNQGLTDSYGRVIFDVSSKKPGEYYLDIFVEGKKLDDKVHLIFY